MTLGENTHNANSDHTLFQRPSALEYLGNVWTPRALLKRSAAVRQPVHEVYTRSGVEKAHWPTQIQAAVRQCAAATWSVSPPWPPHGLSSNSRPDKASTVLRILQANGQATCVEVSRDRARYFTCPGRRNCFCRRSSPLVPHSVQHPTNSPSRVVSRADAARPPDSSGMRRRHAHHDSTTCSLPT